jgi:hypothetical protein
LPRIIVAVVEHPQSAERLNGLFAYAQEYDVIFVEPIARAYSRIKQVTPDVIVLLNEVNEVAAFQLLSMLAMDGSFRGTLVTTFATKRPDSPRTFFEPTAGAPC